MKGMGPPVQHLPFFAFEEQPDGSKVFFGMEVNLLKEFAGRF